jgi:hypothetical protein
MVPAGGHLLNTLAIAAGFFGFPLDVSILALFFFADTVHVILLYYGTLLVLYRAPLQATTLSYTSVRAKPLPGAVP